MQNGWMFVYCTSDLGSVHIVPTRAVETRKWDATDKFDTGRAFPLGKDPLVVPTEGGITFNEAKVLMQNEGDACEGAGVLQIPSWKTF